MVAHGVLKKALAAGILALGVGGYALIADGPCNQAATGWETCNVGQYTFGMGYCEALCLNTQLSNCNAAPYNGMLELAGDCSCACFCIEVSLT